MQSGDDPGWAAPEFDDSAWPTSSTLLFDPPYGFDGWDELLSSIETGTVVIESDREVDVPDGADVGGGFCAPSDR